MGNNEPEQVKIELENTKFTMSFILNGIQNPDKPFSGNSISVSVEREICLEEDIEVLYYKVYASLVRDF